MHEKRLAGGQGHDLEDEGQGHDLDPQPWGFSREMHVTMLLKLL